MNYPEFFDTVASIQLQDPIADILGAFEHGAYEISYLEVVKAAGHSCPTVAGAYLMVDAALKALYPNERAVRGNIKVEFAESLEEGVAGVIGNVISHITGATDKSGFKGLGGKFARHSLMHFDAEISSSARFTRINTQKSVDLFYDPSSVPADPAMMPLMQKTMQGAASKEEMQQFGRLWQERVQRIFENPEKVISAREL
ncbi:MAG: hypothetical protein FAF04_05840 [Epsilonproteobacteria bacterium]|nr:hypothetical protein [Campylobacterota bacterium]